jgi:hypothetical protein
MILPINLSISMVNDTGTSDALFYHIYELRADLPSKTAPWTLLIIYHPSIDHVYKSPPTLHAADVQVIDDILIRVALFCAQSRCYISTCGFIQVPLSLQARVMSSLYPSIALALRLLQIPRQPKDALHSNRHCL